MCLLRPLGSICGGVLGGKGESSAPEMNPKQSERVSLTPTARHLEVKRVPSLQNESSERASLDLTTRHLAVKRAHRHPPRPPPAVRGEGSERAPPVCKWGVLRVSSREGNCVWVKYEEALSPVCIRRGRVSSSDLIFTEWGMARAPLSNHMWTAARVRLRSKTSH